MATAQASESGQRVLLHPLVLLTASDLIVRHRLRLLEGPIAGILLGQQQGTQVTAEYAFTAKLRDGLLDQTDNWTSKRIAQCTHFQVTDLLLANYRDRQGGTHETRARGRRMVYLVP